ncbi:hypothetical protein PUR71_22190 [Streptomyces sp. SP17BM10]|uniref:hypothetical protein n=1 Tax=Streptomyces sp. SP17BM10 TaxID=3002530 RepID=UPI002E798C09|nr:hypothetical protein [Streptomyces sp. SP17BM10]MEE1785592.1 hypothetical protein [Streptomyces sp. SP17BM10]
MRAVSGGAGGRRVWWRATRVNVTRRVRGGRARALGEARAGGGARALCGRSALAAAYAGGPLTSDATRLQQRAFVAGASEPAGPGTNRAVEEDFVCAAGTASDYGQW